MQKEIRKDSLIDFELVKNSIDFFGQDFIRTGNIRIIRKIVDHVEMDSGIKFIPMEMGVPGIKPSQIGIEAEIQALRSDVAGIYPPIDGLPL